MAGTGKPGPPSTGRKLTTLRLWHHEVYLAEANRRGISFTRYVNEVLAERNGLSIPDEADVPGQLALSEHEGAA